jgi:simple sugar transport system permease protein
VNEFILYSFTNHRGLAQTITRGIALLLTSLGTIVVLKLRFWNIGIDGQVWLGAIAATGIATYDFGAPSIRLILMAVAAIVAGSIWVGIPVLLKLRLGVNEVISTLMLTYVAFLIAQHLLYGDWRDPSTSFPVSKTFDADTERLQRIGFGHVHSGIWIALAAALLICYLMLVNRFGFYLTAIGFNVKGAKAAGLKVSAIVTISVMIAGGLCGLAGFTIVSGQEYRLTQYVVHGYTFSAILIAFLARFNPIAVVPISFVVAGLYTAGDTLKTFYQLPLSLILVVEAIILASVVSVEFFARYRLGFKSTKPVNSPSSQGVFIQSAHKD